MKDLLNKSILYTSKQYNIIAFILLATGIALRIFHYLYNRSLWMDELYLSSSFSHVNINDLTSGNLDYQQKAPIGFLGLIWLSVNQFSFDEYALRFIPLIAGLLSVYLFEILCRCFLRPKTTIIAMVIFAFSPALIYHSVEIKQYSMECLATIVSLLIYIKYRNSETWKNRIVWGILGAIILWFSFSAIFILAGIAFGMTVSKATNKDWKGAFNNAVPFSLWLISFIINYLLFTSKHAESSWVVYFFKTYDNFMPLLPHTIQQLKWFPRNFYDLMDYPLGLVWAVGRTPGTSLIRLFTFPLVPLLLLLAGGVSLFKTDKRNFSIFLIAICLTLLASGLYLYPLVERFWVFIAPLFIILIAAGTELLHKKIPSRIVWLTIIIVLTGPPIAQSMYYLFVPETFYKHKKSYARESLEEVNHGFLPDDAVYNYWNNAPAYKVYKDILPLKFKAIQGTDYRKRSEDLQTYNNFLQQELKQFSGKKRIWIIYNTQFLTDIGDFADDPIWYYKSDSSPEKNLIMQVSTIGKPIMEKRWEDVSIVLFDLQ